MKKNKKSQIYGIYGTVKQIAKGEIENTYVRRVAIRSDDDKYKYFLKCFFSTGR